MANSGFKNKLCYNAHGWAFNMKDVNHAKISLYKTVEKKLALKTDRIVCISEYEKESALDNKICTEDKLVVINNGIDFDEAERTIPKTRAELGIPEDAFVVGAVGRLTKQKAPDTFVKAAELIKLRIPNAFFLMVGDGELRAKTEDLFYSEHLNGSYLITDWVDDPMSYAAVFDVALLLSRWEGFGLVLPEYMYLGKPIVSTNADAIPYVLGDAGLLEDIDNSMEVSAAVIRLHSEDELREELIKRGHERVKLFNSERTAKEHVELFKSLLGMSE